MKILAVIDSFGVGGAERLLVSMLPGFTSHGISVEAAVLWPPYDLVDELEGLGVKVHRLDISHRWAIPEALGKLNRMLRKEQYDIAWGSLYFGNLYSALVRLFNPKVKVVFSLHSPGYLKSPPVKPWLFTRMKIEQITGSFLADRIVAVSQAVADDYKRSLGWKNIRVVHNGVLVKSFPAPIDQRLRQEIRRKFAVSDDEFLIVVPARYAPEKGHEVLLSAMALLKKEKGWVPKCVATGQGPLREKIKDKAGNLGFKDEFVLTETLAQDELFALMQAAEALVMPSLREPFGLVAVEAMVLGLPAILSNVDGMRELSGERQSALMVEPGDPQSLAEAIWRLYKEEGLRDKLKETARIHALENFDISRTVSEYREIFNNVVK